MYYLHPIKSTSRAALSQTILILTKKIIEKKTNIYDTKFVSLARYIMRTHFHNVLIRCHNIVIFFCKVD